MGMNSAPQIPPQELDNAPEKPKLSKEEELKIRSQIDNFRNALQVSINEENLITDRISAVPGVELDDSERVQIDMEKRKQSGFQSEIDALERQLNNSQLEG